MKRAEMILRLNPSRPLQLALFVLAFISSACSAEVMDDLGPEELEANEQALVTSSFLMSNAYWGVNAYGYCVSSKPQDIQGYEPSDPGTYPVFVFLNGTGLSFKESGALVFAQEMAARGFVAASVEYPNTFVLGSCTAAQNKARCIYNASSANSAISKLCGRAKADCSKGIVVSGFSQGAHLSSLAKNYDARVRAAYLLGHGHDSTNSSVDLAPCLKDSATALLPSEMRSVNGEHDQYFGQNADGVRSQLQTVVGVSCPGAHNCLQTDGSGWYMVSDSQVSDGKADHRYFFNGGNSGTTFDSTWRSGTVPWSLKANLDWLANRASP